MRGTRSFSTRKAPTFRKKKKNEPKREESRTLIENPSAFVVLGVLPPKKSEMLVAMVFDDEEKEM